MTYLPLERSATIHYRLMYTTFQLDIFNRGAASDPITSSQRALALVLRYATIELDTFGRGTASDRVFLTPNWVA